MLKRRRLNEIVDFLADKAVDMAADYAIDKTADAILDNKEESEECVKPRKRKRIKEEDAETMTPSTTPIGNNGTNPVPATPVANPAVAPNPAEDKKDEPDPMIDFILRQIQKNKDKQIQDAQMDYAYRQQQANKIVADIEDYIKKNSNKQ